MVEIVRRLIVAGLAVGVIAGNADEVTRFYDQTVAHARYLATAADLRSMSNMLDYEYMKKGRYPRKKDFSVWLQRTFKENPLQELSRDHWGQLLVYETDPGRQRFILVSKGPDGLAETSDDLRSTSP